MCLIVDDTRGYRFSRRRCTNGKLDNGFKAEGKVARQWDELRENAVAPAAY